MKHTWPSSAASNDGGWCGGGRIFEFGSLLVHVHALQEAQQAERAGGGQLAVNQLAVTGSTDTGAVHGPLGQQLAGAWTVVDPDGGSEVVHFRGLDVHQTAPDPPCLRCVRIAHWWFSWSFYLLGELGGLVRGLVCPVFHFGGLVLLQVVFCSFRFRSCLRAFPGFHPFLDTYRVY